MGCGESKDGFLEPTVLEISHDTDDINDVEETDVIDYVNECNKNNFVKSDNTTECQNISKSCKGSLCSKLAIFHSFELGKKCTDSVNSHIDNGDHHTANGATKIAVEPLQLDDIAEDINGRVKKNHLSSSTIPIERKANNSIEILEQLRTEGVLVKPDDATNKFISFEIDNESLKVRSRKPSHIRLDKLKKPPLTKDSLDKIMAKAERRRSHEKEKAQQRARSASVRNWNKVTTEVLSTDMDSEEQCPTGNDVMFQSSNSLKLHPFFEDWESHTSEDGQGSVDVDIHRSQNEPHFTDNLKNENYTSDKMKNSGDIDDAKNRSVTSSASLSGLDDSGYGSLRGSSKHRRNSSAQPLRLSSATSRRSRSVTPERKMPHFRPKTSKVRKFTKKDVSSSDSEGFWQSGPLPPLTTSLPAMKLKSALRQVKQKLSAEVPAVNTGSDPLGGVKETSTKIVVPPIQTAIPVTTASYPQRQRRLSLVEETANGESMPPTPPNVPQPNAGDRQGVAKANGEPMYAGIQKKKIPPIQPSPLEENEDPETVSENGAEMGSETGTLGDQKLEILTNNLDSFDETTEVQGEIASGDSGSSYKLLMKSYSGPMDNEDKKPTEPGFKTENFENDDFIDKNSQILVQQALSGAE